jgi:protein involved in polysaccharide export with SLBB domain
MGRLRSIRVYVVGEVCQPGSFTLSSLSTVTNGLFAAGGPLKLGSLRNIQLKRNHHGVGAIDLYDFLLRGDKTRDFRLEPGDTIFVPPIGPIAAVTGEVKRPAIYELKGTTRVSDLIEMAGGLTPQSYLKRVQVIRTRPNAEREVIDLDLTGRGSNGDSPKDIEIMNGDVVRVYPTDPRIYNTVRLTGAVKHPGEYELKPGMRLHDLLHKENFLPEAYADRIEIARLKDDLTTEILSIDIKKAWEMDESQDIPLQRLDLIAVRSEFKAPGSIRLEGEVLRPGVYRFTGGERLSSVLKRAGGFTEKAYLRGAVFTRASVREVEKKKLDEMVKSYEQFLVADASLLTPVATGGTKEEAAFQQAILAQRRRQLQSLSSKVTVGRVVIRLDELDKFEETSSDLVLEDGDSLMIPQKPATILVMGSVRSPTGIIYEDNMDVQYYLNRAGGVTREADEKGIHILKADGSAIAAFVRLRNIEPGDVIVVPPSSEPKVSWLPLLRDAVTVAGQFTLGLAGVRSIFRR